MKIVRAKKVSQVNRHTQGRVWNPGEIVLYEGCEYLEIIRNPAACNYGKQITPGRRFVKKADYDRVECYPSDIPTYREIEDGESA